MKRALRRVDSSEQLLLALEPPELVPDSGGGGNLRRVITGSDIIAYRLQRVRRRSIGFQVDEAGLKIRAPRWVTLREIEAAIVENQRWIRKKQIEWRRWHQERQCAATRFADGGAVQYLGRAMTLRLGADSTSVGDNDIRLALPVDAIEAEVREALHEWLRHQARHILAERLQRFADRVEMSAGPPQAHRGPPRGADAQAAGGVHILARFAGWRLSSARTQWGSCSQDGRIRLNWRLVHFALPVIDYVIAHELAHLIELNHSPRFWRTVAHLLPGFEAARDQIKRAPMPVS
ncbi:MAG: M48 family metallopeptidase [Burkholderiaceae bacterium]